MKNNIIKITPELAKNLLPERSEKSNKGTFGKVLNIAGCSDYQGAAFLSSLAPLKIGAGLVTLASTETVINNLASCAPWITFAHLKDYEKRCISKNATDDIKKIIDNYDVISIGPGLSIENEVIGFVEEVMNLLNDNPHPKIWDADALNCISKIKPEKLPQNSVITPHPMELSRLIEIPVDEIQQNREEYAKYASEKFGCSVILKGHQTVICANKEIYQNTTGGSALAKAGSGDVLTGIIAGLLSQKMDITKASILGVFLHGLCGDIASKDMTDYCVLATDQIDYLPKAIKYLLNN